MRKITIELYANSEYSLDDRLKEIKWAITKIVWPSCCFTDGSRKHLSQAALKKKRISTF